MGGTGAFSGALFPWIHHRKFLDRKFSRDMVFLSNSDIIEMSRLALAD